MQPNEPLELPEVPEGRHIIAHRETVGRRIKDDQESRRDGTFARSNVPPLRGLTLGLTLPHRFTVAYDVPSLRDWPMLKN